MWDRSALLKLVHISPLLHHMASSFTYSNMQTASVVCSGHGLAPAPLSSVTSCIITSPLPPAPTMPFLDTSLFSWHPENPDLVSDARPSHWLAPLPGKCFPWTPTGLAPSPHSVLQPSVCISEGLPRSPLAGILFSLKPPTQHIVIDCLLQGFPASALSVLWTGAFCAVGWEGLSRAL